MNDRIDWKEVLADMRAAVRRGADRVEYDVKNDVVRGLRETSQTEGRETPRTITRDEK
jgi:hypothetical protein